MDYRYTTLFFHDISNQDCFVVLHTDEKLIDEDDITKGYICQEELLSIFSHLIQETDIGPNSYLIEYMVPHVNEEPFETVRLRVSVRKTTEETVVRQEN